MEKMRKKRRVLAWNNKTYNTDRLHRFRVLRMIEQRKQTGRRAKNITQKV